MFGGCGPVRPDAYSMLESDFNIPRGYFVVIEWKKYTYGWNDSEIYGEIKFLNHTNILELISNSVMYSESNMLPVVPAYLESSLAAGGRLYFYEPDKSNPNVFYRYIVASNRVRFVYNKN